MKKIAVFYICFLIALPAFGEKVQIMDVCLDSSVIADPRWELSEGESISTIGDLYDALTRHITADDLNKIAYLYAEYSEKVSADIDFYKKIYDDDLRVRLENTLLKSWVYNGPEELLFIFRNFYRGGVCYAVDPSLLLAALFESYPEKVKFYDSLIFYSMLEKTIRFGDKTEEEVLEETQCKKISGYASMWFKAGHEILSMYGRPVNEVWAMVCEKPRGLWVYNPVKNNIFQMDQNQYSINDLMEKRTDEEILEFLRMNN